MSVSFLLKSVDRDTEGAELVLRVIGTREPPARMVIQIAILGKANIQIQGRIARDAPWQNIGDPWSASALFHVDAVPFLRALATNVAASTTATAWAVWAW